MFHIPPHGINLALAAHDPNPAVRAQSYEASRLAALPGRASTDTRNGAQDTFDPLGSASLMLALRALGDHLWQRTTQMLEQIVALHGQLDAGIFSGGSATGSQLGLAAGIGLPTSVALSFPVVRAPARRVAQVATTPEAHRLWPDYQALPPIDSHACGDAPMCCLTLLDLAELNQPVAAQGERALQVYEYADLKRFWRLFPERANATPSHMPVKALFQVVRPAARHNKGCQ